MEKILSMLHACYIDVVIILISWYLVITLLLVFFFFYRKNKKFNNVLLLFDRLLFRYESFKSCYMSPWSLEHMWKSLKCSSLVDLYICNYIDFYNSRRKERKVFNPSILQNENKLQIKMELIENTGLLIDY